MASPQPRKPQQSTPILASEGWHQFITVILLLVCLAIVYSSAIDLLAQSRRQPLGAADFLQLGGPGLIALAACRYLAGELRASFARSRKTNQHTRKIT